MGVVGIFVLLGIAFALSNNRRLAVNWRIIGWGFGLQVQSLSAFLLRAQFAHSTDATFLRLAVDPIADQRAKKRRL